jgi:GNAT superfamily N-acetyltransferase
MSLHVREVATAADRRAFLKIPFQVFADDPNWVAPLFIEREEHLSPKKNPYFLHADVALFIAERDGRPVGRISAQHDRLRLEHHRDATGLFGFLDALDDPEVFAALLGAAAQWLKARDLARMEGPFTFSINDETGLLVDGFATPPVMMMGHARPYYARHVEAAGLIKAKDVIAYDYDGLKPLPRAMQAMIGKAHANGDLSVRALSKKDLARDLAIIIGIFNDAWSENWGFVPMTEEEITALGKNLKMLVAERYIAIASYRGEPAAMAVSLPDINRWIKDLNGRLLPFGWAKLAFRLLAKPPEAVRVPLMGLRKKFHGTAIGSALVLAAIDSIREYHLARGTRRAELSWILEDNIPMRRMIESLGGVPYKTYRVYGKSIA